jgi:hypothetical protein
MAKMKKAMRVAGELEDDRKTLVTRDGRTLEQLAQAAGATRHRDEERGSTIYTFSDGSRLVALRGRWDLGFTGCACACRVGAGHDKECPELARVAERAQSRRNGTAGKPEQQEARRKRGSTGRQLRGLRATCVYVDVETGETKGPTPWGAEPDEAAMRAQVGSLIEWGKDASGQMLTRRVTAITIERERNILTATFRVERVQPRRGLTGRRDPHAEGPPARRALRDSS